MVAAVAGAIAASIGASALATAAIQIAISVAASVALSFLTSKPKPKVPSIADRGRQEMIRQPLSARRIVYGRQMLSGPIVYAQSSGPQNTYLSIVILIAAHEIEAFDEFWLDDVKVEIDQDGGVTTARYNANGVPYAWIYPKFGTDDQAADPVLIEDSVDGAWTAQHRLRGIAYIHAKFRYNSTIYPDGVPKVRAVVRGKKVYDPRSTQTAYSDNAALCINDLMRDPMRIATEDIAEPTVIAAANVCDEQVPLNAGGTEARYAAGGIVELDEKPTEALQEMISAMAGTIVDTGGQFRMFAGAAQAATLSLDESHLAGPIRVTPRLSRSEIYNAVRATHISPERDWQATSAPEIDNALYLSQDNDEPILKTLELPFTLSSAAAQRISKIELERVRQQITVTMRVQPGIGLQIQAWGVVRVSNEHFGWTDKEFRVHKWQLQPDLSVSLTLREEAPEIWDWNSGEETTVDPAPDTNLPDPWTVQPVRNLQAASGTEFLFPSGDGSIITRVNLTWNAPEDAFVGRVEIQSKKNTETEWQDKGQIDGGLTTVLLSGYDDAELYNFRARYRNVVGAVGPWTSISHTIVGKTEPPPGVTSASLRNGFIVWTYPDPPIDFAGFQLRRNTGNNQNWSGATILHDGIITDTSFPLPEASGTNTVLIKAIDTTGNESIDAGFVILNLGDPLFENIVITQDEKAAGWPGTLVNGTIEGGTNDLIANDNGQLYWPSETPPGGVGPFDANYWPPDPSATNYWTVTFKEMQYSNTFTPTPDQIPSALTVVADVEGETWTEFYRNAPSQNYWPDPLTTNYWPADTNDDTWPPFGPWIPFPGRIEMREVLPYEVAIITAAGVVQGRIREMTFTADVPDIVEGIEDFTVASGGARLPITKEYRVIVSVVMTIQDDGGSNDAVVALVIDKDATLGPLVRCLNRNGNDVAGRVDAIIQGY